MSLSNEQVLEYAAIGLTSALESVVYVHEQGIDLDDEMLADLRTIVLKAKELLSL
ncbi:hypothetical protein D3C85_1853460 [compost metagenome]